MTAEDPMLTIEKGETLASVQNKLGVKHAPVLDEEDPRGTTFYEFPERGTWVFFDNKNMVRSVRFNAPFPYAVEGIRIGDTREHVREVRGTPDRLHPMDEKERWVYDKPRFLRVDFDPATNRVDEIYR